MLVFEFFYVMIIQEKLALVLLTDKLSVFSLKIKKAYLRRYSFLSR